MAELTTSIRNVLINDGPVVALCSTRVWYLQFPQNPVFPAIILQELGNTPRDDINGNAGLFRSEIQVDVYGAGDTALDDAKALRQAVRKALQGFSDTVLGVTIKGIYLLNMIDSFETEIANYRSILRFGVWYREENPDS